jgi:hypothetical protein
MPFPGKVGVIASVLEECGHGHDVAAKDALIMLVLRKLRRQHLRNVRDTGKMRVDTG